MPARLSRCFVAKAEFAPVTEPAARAVVSDDGSTISLTSYTEAGAAVLVALAPLRAVALADELIRAALPKLRIAEESSSPKRRRGGDPFAEQRRELHNGLHRMASLLGLEGKPAVKVAREIIDRDSRYQPMSVETEPLRCEMRRVRNTGLSVPKSPRHLARIISNTQKQKS